jgi:hypothetical protein
MVLESYTE